MAGLLTNANYINDTIKPAIKSAIEAQGVTVPSTDSFLDYADRIAEIEGGGGDGYVLQDLPTGAISTFNDGVDLPLNSLKVSIEAVQSGSGTPSPQNIRPITGWDSVTITDKDDLDNPTVTKVTTIPLSSTCYGGELDVGSGMYDGTMGEVDLGDLSWSERNTDTSGVYRMLATISPSPKPTASSSDVAKMQCEIYEAGTNNDTFNRVNGKIAIGTSGTVTVYDDRYNQSGDSTAFKAAMQGVKLVYELATPTTTQIAQPTAIRTLDGVNNLWADCGNILDGEYFSGSAPKLSKVDYTIGSGSQPMLADGRYLSGFASMSGYGAFPRDDNGSWLDVDWGEDFEIGSAFKVSSFPSSGNMTIFGCGISGSMNYAPNVYFWNGSTAYITLSENGSSSAVDTALNYTFQTDTWYFVRAKFTKSTLNLKIEVSTDMSNFTTAYNDTLAAVPYHDAASICIGGMAQSANYASNKISIDLYNTYIKSGGNMVWGALSLALPS